MKGSAWLKTLFIITIAASLLLLCGCAGKKAVEETGTPEAEEEVPETEYEINTEDIESDLDLSELDGIDEELDNISW